MKGCINYSSKEFKKLSKWYGDDFAESIIRYATIVTEKDLKRKGLENTKGFHYPSTRKEVIEWLDRSTNKNKKEIFGLITNALDVDPNFPIEGIEDVLKGVINFHKDTNSYYVTKGRELSGVMGDLVDEQVYRQNLSIVRKLESLYPGRFNVKRVKESSSRRGSTRVIITKSNPKFIQGTLFDISRRGQVDPEAEYKYFFSGRTQSGLDVVTKISVSNHPLNKLARALIPFLRDRDIPISLHDTLREGIAGLYNSNSESIHISKFARFRGLGVEPTILHEVLHYLTYSVLRSENNQAVKDFNELFKKIKNGSGAPTDIYTFKNLDEFIVGIFTDAELISYLKDQNPVELSSGKEYKNLLQQVLDHILSLFKITDNQPTLYSQAIAIASNIVGADSSLVENTFQNSSQEYWNSLSDSILFDRESNEIKAGSVVDYNGKEYLVRKINSSGKAQLMSIGDNPENFSGTPNLDKVSFKYNLPIITHTNGSDYVVLKGDRIFSLATGKKVYSGNNNSEKVQRESILSKWNKAIGANATNPISHTENSYREFEPANEEQKNAIKGIQDFIEKSNSSQWLVIEGKAGTGKTTIVQEALKDVIKNKKVIISALSHKAKNVLANKLESRFGKNSFSKKSIAGLLGMKMDPTTGKFSPEYNPTGTIPPIVSASVIVVDEASMINEEALALIMKLKRKDAKVIFLGDSGQLPPIRNSGDANSGKISPVFNSNNKFVLIERIRQGEESPILPYADFYWNNSHKENPEKNPVSPENRKGVASSEGSLVYASYDESVRLASELFNEAILEGNPNKVRVVTYRNNSRNRINSIVRSKVFGDSAQFQIVSGELMMFGDNYNDPSNDEKYENSEEVQVEIAEETETFDGWKILLVKFKDGREVSVIKDEDKGRLETELKNRWAKTKIPNISKFERRVALDAFWKLKNRFAPLEYSYAITSHKSQGSTYETVIVDEPDIMSVSMTSDKSKSQSMYTAITRASNTVVIISDAKISTPTITEAIELSRKKTVTSNIDDNKDNGEVKKNPAVNTNDKNSKNPISDLLTLEGKVSGFNFTWDEFFEGNTKEKLSEEDLNTITNLLKNELMKDPKRITSIISSGGINSINSLSDPQIKNVLKNAYERAVDQFINETNPTVETEISDSVNPFSMGTTLMGTAEDYQEYRKNATAEEGSEEDESDLRLYMITKIISENNNSFNGLSSKDNQVIVEHLTTRISSMIPTDPNAVTNKQEVFDAVKDEYFNTITPLVTRLRENLNKLRVMYNQSPSEGMKNIIRNSEKLLDKAKIVRDNWDSLMEDAFNSIQKDRNIKQVNLDEDSFSSNDEVEVEKNHSKTSLEESSKHNVSYMLKQLFRLIENKTIDGKPIKGILGLPTYVGYDTVYNTIEQLMSSPHEVDSYYDILIKRLEDQQDTIPWLRDAIQALKNSSQQIKNQFTYNFVKHTLSMKFIMVSKNRRTGKNVLTVYDTNSTEITRVIKTSWEQQFKTSNLVEVDPTTGNYKINKKEASKLYADFQEMENKAKNNKSKEITNEQMHNFLESFGITITNEALNQIRSDGIYDKASNGYFRFKNMFRESSNTFGIFGLLGNYLRVIQNIDDTEFEENPANNPYSNIRKSINAIAKIEAKYASYATTNSFRDGGKSIYGFTASKYATDAVNRLRDPNDSSYRDSLLSKSYNKHSYLLNLLASDPNFAEKFSLDHIGITAMKLLMRKSFGDVSATSLSKGDFELMKLGFFQAKGQGKIEGNLRGIEYRSSRMLFPTMSDKSQAFLLLTAALDIKAKNMYQDQMDGTWKMRDNLKDILYDQLVKPELERIIQFHSTIKNTNISGYDKAAQLFWFIPELNNMVDESNGGKRAISLMANDPFNFDMKWFEDNFKDKAKDIISNLIQAKVRDKIRLWSDSGFITEEEGVLQSNYLDDDYLNKFTGVKLIDKLELAANDYIINNMLTMANLHMTIIGDIALYSPASQEGNTMISKIEKYFKDGEVWIPKDEYGNTAYAMALKDVVGINMGKRLALLSAPGAKIANSKNDVYLQLFLQDKIDISSNILDLIRLFYGKGEMEKATPLIEKYYSDEIRSIDRTKIVNDLQDKYPRISDFFDIESTDAQEYTTLKEHVDILFRQGRIPDSTYAQIQAKIGRQKARESMNQPIPPEDILSFAELNMVLQPIKPVYTGQIDDSKYDVMRTMYIKSSSFPLIPQLTKGSALDGVRRMMEKLETEEGKNVRASYQTANKVGSVSTALNVFEDNGDFRTDITSEEISASSLLLDRNNFRIQQDVPPKFMHRNRDRNTQGSQLLKILFGDGITEIAEKDSEGNLLNPDHIPFKYNGQDYSGRELRDKFNEVYEGYINHKLTVLRKELGIDEEGNPIDVEKTMNSLQELLKSEAIDRGFPRQDVEGLKLIPELDQDGKVVNVSFNIPIWMSPNSNRYESLLNSIVTKRLSNIKLPGNSYVLGSEAGFKFQSNFEGIDQNRIIFTSKFKGELQGLTYSDNGKKINKAQVFVRSSFRDNYGNLIELIHADGSINEKYVYREDSGRLRLKEDMIDSDLLSMTSFRIPTSGHVSTSQFEIVGILPPENADLMIIPRNFTKQKGIDFDIDKETTYQLHSYIDSSGKIRILDERGKRYIQSQVKVEEERDKNKLLRNNFSEDRASLSDSIETMLYENEIAKIHESVLSNPTEDVQRKINKVLSISFAKGQAALIQSLSDSEKDYTTFTTLDDTYQHDKMELGAAGKLGIAVYSNFVTFSSMLQQNDADIALLSRGEKGKIEPFRLQIGDLVSDGRLGRINTLGSSRFIRSIAEVLAELQNTATDNEKEQIMGRVNINELTINAQSLMVILGFDKSFSQSLNREVSIPYLLMSQPIIKDYVDLMKKSKSITEDYNAEAREDIINSLLEKYSSSEGEASPNMLTADNLIGNITNPTNNIQTEVLKVFIKLDAYSIKVSRLMGRLNINSSGLGKSMFETIDKYDAIGELQNTYENSGDSINIRNASKLVGDYIGIKNKTKEEISSLRSQGYIPIRDVMIKPNNPVAHMLVNSVWAGYNLWNQHFPYDSLAVREATNMILNQITSESTSDSKMVELREEVFKEMKKYFVSTEKTGLFKGNAQKERYRLFMDNKDANKVSLATYLNDIMMNDERLRKTLKSNPLLSRFTFDLNKNGMISIIKFDNVKGENYEEDNMYNAIIQLFQDNTPLPEFNGDKNYSTRKLAADLIAYSYLSGGVQEAIQFVKYIPVSVLDAVGFGEKIRMLSNPKNNKEIRSILKQSSSVDSNYKGFVLQYFLHHPERLVKVNPEVDILSAKYISNGKESIKGKIENLEEFTINGMVLMMNKELKNADFVSIYNPDLKKGTKKFQIYHRSGNSYVRVPTLGVFGMDEYSMEDDSIQSIVNKPLIPRIGLPIKNEEVDPNQNSSPFNIPTSTAREILEKISTSTGFYRHPGLPSIAKAYLQYIPDNIKIKISPIENEQGEKLGLGSYDSNTNTITIDSGFYAEGSSEDIAKTLLHEITHYLTVNYISKFIDGNGNKLPGVDKVPADIRRLVILYNQVKDHLGEEGAALSRKISDAREKKAPVSLNEDEANILYAGYNIFEFISLAMTQREFQQKMNEVNYLSTNKTLLEKFIDLMNNIISSILGDDYNINGVTAVTVGTVINLLDDIHGINRFSNNPHSIIKEANEAENNSNAAISQLSGVIMPNLNELELPDDMDLTDNNDINTFEEDNPFLCPL